MTKKRSTHSSTNQPGTSAAAGVGAAPGSGAGSANGALAIYLATQTQGIDILREIHEARLTAEQLVHKGVDDSHAKRLISATKTFFTPVKHRRVQADLQKQCAEKQLPLDALTGIGTQFRQLIAHKRLVPTKILANLIDEAEGPVPHIISQARDTIRTINEETRTLIVKEAKESEEAGEPATAPELPKPKLTGGDQQDARGMSALHFQDDAHEISAILSGLEPAARKLMRSNSNLTLPEARAIALKSAVNPALFGTDPQEIPAGKPFTPLVVMNHEDYQNLQRGKTSYSAFGMTDGMTILATQLAARGLSDKRYFQVTSPDGTPTELYETHPELIDDSLCGAAREAALENTLRPVPGELNLGRSQRVLNRKQRIVASGMTLVCAWPGCNKGAMYADGHHITAWKNGGPTDLDNITFLCSFHNGLNDDDRDRPKNGHVVMRDWEIHFQPPTPNATPIPPYGHMTKLTSVALAKGASPPRPPGPEEPDPPPA